MDEVNKKIGTIGLNDAGESVYKEPIFISISEYKKTKFLDIRKYYEENKEWKPTKKGITLNLEQFTHLIGFLKEKESEILNLLKED